MSNSRVDRCHLVASVLAADGIVTENERAFLRELMDAHGLTDEERQHVREFRDADGALERLQRLPEDERAAIVDELLQAAFIDAKLSPVEREHVQRLVEALRAEMRDA